MCQKIRCDGESKKFCKIFWKLNRALLDNERNSLLNRIATLESGLAAARDRVLRICTEPNSMERMKSLLQRQD
jgi:hypothetical protein